jgi:hypothetical protein
MRYVLLESSNLETMPDLSDREHDAFDNPAKALCRDGNLRVLWGAAYRWRERVVTIHERKEPGRHVHHHHGRRDERRRRSHFEVLP